MTPSFAYTRLETPTHGPTDRDVIVLELARRRVCPLEARRQLDALATLHAKHDVNAFYRARHKIAPGRLPGATLPFNRMPELSMRIDSFASLRAAELLFSTSEMGTDTLSSASCFDVLLHVRLDSKEIEDEHGDACGYLERLAVVLEQLTGARASRYRLATIELCLGVYYQDRIASAVARVCRVALRDVKRSTVSLQIPHRGFGPSCSLEAWGELFQSVCRIGRGSSYEVCSLLKISFNYQTDPRLVAAVWSAVGSSRGYTSIEVDEELGDGDHTANSLLTMRYMALALGTNFGGNYLKRLKWKKLQLTVDQIDVMQQIQKAAATSMEALAQVMWHPDWSTGHVLEITPLNESIVKSHGWVLCDTGDSAWLDVFVPGFGQCTVKRQQWIELNVDPRGVRVQAKLQPTLTSLHFRLGSSQPESLTQLIRFVPVIGATLVNLELHGADRKSRTCLTLEGLLCVFESCARLSWLSVQNLELQEPVEVVADRIVCTNLKSLVLKLRESSATSAAHLDPFMAALVPIAGMQLEYVTLSNFDGDSMLTTAVMVPFTQSFHALVRNSRRLQRVRLQLFDIGEIDPLLDAYRDDGSQLSHLHLVKCHVDCESLDRLADFLKDTTSDAARALTYLWIDETFTREQHAQPVLDDENVPALLEMLRVNNTLATLVLVGQVDPDDVLKPFVPKFEAFQGQQLPTMERSLELDAKLAFLSVLARHEWSWDAHTVSMIFGFAAKRVTRIASLTLH